jgi:predicted nucleic acid-binding protein
MQARPRQSLYLTLVTRNTKDFEGLGVQGVNPWDA